MLPDVVEVFRPANQLKNSGDFPLGGDVDLDYGIVTQGGGGRKKNGQNQEKSASFHSELLFDGGYIGNEC